MVTVDLTINILRPAVTLPLIATATTLRAGDACSPPRCTPLRKQPAG
jgi:hypothetical protein